MVCQKALELQVDALQYSCCLKGSILLTDPRCSWLASVLRSSHATSKRANRWFCTKVLAWNRGDEVVVSYQPVQSSQAAQFVRQSRQPIAGHPQLPQICQQPNCYSKA